MLCHMTVSSKADALRAMREANYAAKSSRGGGESRPAAQDRQLRVPVVAGLPPEAVVARGPREAKSAFRKPLAKDAHKTLMATKPWEAEGLSRRTWYRRKKEAVK